MEEGKGGITMSWKEEIKKSNADKKKLQKVLGKLNTLKTNYNIKDKDFEDIREPLIQVLNGMAMFDR